MTINSPLVVQTSWGNLGQHPSLQMRISRFPRPFILIFFNLHFSIAYILFLQSSILQISFIFGFSVDGLSFSNPHDLPFWPRALGYASLCLAHCSLKSISPPASLVSTSVLLISNRGNHTIVWIHSNSKSWFPPVLGTRYCLTDLLCFGRQPSLEF